MQKNREELDINRVRFLGEQDGTAERELKLKLKELFTKQIKIKEAYLVRVVYNEMAEWSVALCLTGSPDQASLIQIQHLFQQMFRSNEHLDVLVLSLAQEQEVKNVAKPFFSSSIPQVRQ
jgi:hypothetical protein